MKIFRIAILAAVTLCASAAATRITDVLTTGTGDPMRGRIFLSGPVGSSTTPSTNVTINLGTSNINGAALAAGGVDINLVGCQGCTYRAQFQLTNASGVVTQTYTETWVVPDTTDVLTVPMLRVGSAATSGGMISAAQFNPAGYQVGQSLIWSGTNFAPGYVTGTTSFLALTGVPGDNPALSATLALKAALASPVFTGQVTIPDFTLAGHTHLNAAGGGALDSAAIASGVLAIARIPTGTSGSTVSLGNHGHTGIYEPANANIQSHITSTANPHAVSLTQVLGAPKCSSFTPTDGQSLVYDFANTCWGPSSITSGGELPLTFNAPLGRSVNTISLTACADSEIYKYRTATGWTCEADQTGTSGGGITSLGGLTGSSQTFAVGTTGTSPGVSSSGTTHTINIPLASTGSVTAGLLSNTKYAEFDAKQTAITGAPGTWPSFGALALAGYPSAGIVKSSGSAFSAAAAGTDYQAPITGAPGSWPSTFTPSAHTHPMAEITDAGNSATLNVGTTTGTVAAGDDSRLSDARTPTAHAASHAFPGGLDAISPTSIGAEPANANIQTHISSTSNPHGVTLSQVLGAPKCGTFTPTDGQALVYDFANTCWKPADIATPNPTCTAAISDTTCTITFASALTNPEVATVPSCWYTDADPYDPFIPANWPIAADGSAMTISFSALARPASCAVNISGGGGGSGSGTGANENGYYFVSRSTNAPTNAVNFGALTSGILKHTVSGSVSTPSVAVAGTDYQAPISGAPGSWPSTFAPSAHATSHQNGGADEIATATAAANAIPKAGAGGTLATGWLPTIGVSGGGTGLTSGTSGGVLAFTATGTLASSGALTANLPVIGGGAGVAPSVGTRSGNTTAFVTTTGAQTSGRCVEIDANGNHIAAAAGCASGTGTVTVVGAGSLTSTALVTGGGTTTLQTPSATTTLDSSGNMAIAGNLTVSGASGITLGTGSVINGSTDGYHLLTDNAGTGYTGLRFGTATSASPMWKRSSAAFNARLADDSADAAVTAATAAADTNTTQVATTAYVIGQKGTATPIVDGTGAAGTSSKWTPIDHVHPTDTSRAPLASPTFTGTPAAPTAAADTNTTQIATTAYYIGQKGTASPAMDGSAAAGTSAKFSPIDHVHPTDTSRAPTADPTFTGVVDASGATSVIVKQGTAAPSSGLCDAAGEVGSLYVQSGDPASVNLGVFRCTQTGASSYAWHPISHIATTAAPATCTVGQMFFDTDATAGQNWFGCTASNTWTLQGDGGGGGANLDTATGDIATAQIEAGAVTPAKLAFLERHVLLTGSGTSGVLQDADDQPAVWFNQSGGNMTIAQVWCTTDSATATTIQLQKDDGSAADMLSSNLSCSSTKANTTTFVSGENVLADGDNLNAVIVSAGGAGKWVSIHIKVTY